jgi:hypothetical protein
MSGTNNYKLTEEQKEINKAEARLTLVHIVLEYINKNGASQNEKCIS